MTIDLLTACEITGGAALVIVTFTAVFGRALRERILIASGLSAWYLLVLASGATDFFGYGSTIGTPALGIAVAVPLIVLAAIAFSPIGRARIESAPLLPIVAIQATRVEGVTFLILFAAHRLPAPFAPVAGWGDIIAGLAALPVAWWLSRDPRGAHGAFLAVVIFGILDLCTALALGAASHSAVMTAVPYIGIPCFLVPSLLFMEFVALYKVQRAPAFYQPRNAVSS